MAELDKRRAIIAGRLRIAREQAGLSQGQVAKKLNLHRPSISEAEAGRRQVSAVELAELSSLYGVAVSWLAGGDAESVDPERDRIELAARELKKLKPDDLDRLLKLIAALKNRGGEG